MCIIYEFLGILPDIRVVVHIVTIRVNLMYYLWILFIRHCICDVVLIMTRILRKREKNLLTRIPLMHSVISYFLKKKKLNSSGLINTYFRRGNCSVSMWKDWYSLKNGLFISDTRQKKIYGFVLFNIYTLGEFQFALCCSFFFPSCLSQNCITFSQLSFITLCLCLQDRQLSIWYLFRETITVWY